MIENINLIEATVTPELHGYMYEGVYNYHGVLNVGNKLGYAVVSNNEITIKDGLLCNQGRFMRIVGTESLAIENGTSGVNRIDLIVAHFETDGITETHDIRVVKGSANGGAPSYADNDIYAGGTSSDLVLYEVTLDGLTISKVEQKFELIEPLLKVAKATSIVERFVDNADFNKLGEVSKISFARVGGTMTNAPADDAMYYNVITMSTSESDGYFTQVAIDRNTVPKMYVRRALNGSWGAWCKLADSNELGEKAPTSHASSATTYGIGTSSNYGHVKLSDSTTSTSSTSSGIAATPKAVKAVKDLLGTQVTYSLSGTTLTITTK